MNSHKATFSLPCIKKPRAHSGTSLEIVAGNLFGRKTNLEPFLVRNAYDWLCWGLTTRQPLRVILCRLPEKGRKEIEERVEEMKERDREERGTGTKVKKQKK